MVIDKIENFKLYECLSERIAKAFTFINETDLSAIALGKYEIDKDDIFALVQEYDTKDENECKLEGHSRYIDVQYIISGVELIGVRLLKEQKPVTKNEENDYTFYEGDSDLIRIDKGMFAIFFPEDLHMPCIKSDQRSRVKKVVVKVKI